MVSALIHNVLVIGGGPAGASAAIRLRQHGIRTTLAEAETFPRDKVCGCCMSGTGLDTLRILGCGSVAESDGHRIETWLGWIGGRRIQLAMPNSIAIAREVLDDHLVRHAGELGCVIRQPSLAKIISAESDKVMVRFSKVPLATNRVAAAPIPQSDRLFATSSSPAESSVGSECNEWVGQNSTASQDVTEGFDAVVFASGLRGGGISQWLPWQDPPHGPFGWSTKVHGMQEFPSRTVVMACDHDGYLGIVKLNDGRVDVAAALSGGAAGNGAGRPIERVAAMLRRAKVPGQKSWFDGHWFRGAPDRETASVMTTGPLQRKRLPGRGRLLAIGDAAEYVEPFTGEGMTWGMLSGIAAADWIARHTGSAHSVGDGWALEHDRLLGRSRQVCRWIATTLRHELPRRAAGALISRFPSLGSPLVRHLNRTPSIEAMASPIRAE
ncbi:MAG: FAD-dependent monooxygenase [Planctomycetota bacterium]